MRKSRHSPSLRVALVEALTVADVGGLAAGTGCLTVFTNEQGGVEDDLIVTNAGGKLLAPYGYTSLLLTEVLSQFLCCLCVQPHSLFFQIFFYLNFFILLTIKLI